VHATLAGVIMAMFIPMKSLSNSDYSPLKDMENDLHSVVAFIILPVFAFANAGISLQGVGTGHYFHDVPLGIAMGLFLGKQVGIFGICWLAIQLKLTSLPKGMTWSSLYGTAILCGIGFTMSLFIGSLAFEAAVGDRIFDERMGIIMGSLASGLFGYFVLRVSLPSRIKVNKA
jgi:Na+:H+ antiporter, NhaA family